MKYFISLVLFAVIYTGCFHTNVSYPFTQKVWGNKPVYTADTSYRKIKYIPAAQPVENAGKIYVKDNFIYQCDIGKGIHIIDNTNPSKAKRIAFLSVNGCEEISIRNNFLYTNNYYDLVTIDISDFKRAYVVARNRNAFFSQSSKPHTWETPADTGYFECPQFYLDSVISGWVKDSIYQSCYK